MKAFVKTGTRSGEAGIEDVARPEPGSDEVLLRVASCGICGSDLHAFNADPGFEWVKPPITLGHEFSGTVEEVGPDTAEADVGDRVVAVAIQGCGECAVCESGSTQLCPNRVAVGLSRDGGMAGYAVVPARHLVPVPDGLDLAAAALAEPLAVAVHAVNFRADIRPGDKVVVSGPGPIGILCAMLARIRAGADVLLTGVGADSEFRLPAAERAGLRTANLSDAPLEEHLRREFGGEPDVWIESSGSVRALDSAIKSARPGGSVVVVGLYAEDMNFSPTLSVRRETSILFSYSCNRADYETALELLADGGVNPAPLLSKHPLENAPEAFERVRRGETVKAMLEP